MAPLEVEKVLLVLDAGRVINPHAAAEQCEGSVCWELSHAWTGGLELEDGRFVNTNFDTYNLLRIDKNPHVETIFGSSGGKKWEASANPPARLCLRPSPMRSTTRPGSASGRRRSAATI